MQTDLLKLLGQEGIEVTVIAREGNDSEFGSLVSRQGARLCLTPQSRSLASSPFQSAGLHSSESARKSGLVGEASSKDRSGHRRKAQDYHHQTLPCRW